MKGLLLAAALLAWSTGRAWAAMDATTDNPRTQADQETSATTATGPSGTSTAGTVGSPGTTMGESGTGSQMSSPGVPMSESGPDALRSDETAMEPLAPAGDIQQATGRVRSIDGDTLALRTGLFGSSSYSVSSDAMILSGSRRMQLSELKPGDRVDIRFIKQDGRNVAQSIAVRDSGASSESRG